MKVLSNNSKFKNPSFEAKLQVYGGEISKTKKNYFQRIANNIGNKSNYITIGVFRKWTPNAGVGLYNIIEEHSFNIEQPPMKSQNIVTVSGSYTQRMKQVHKIIEDYLLELKTALNEKNKIGFIRPEE